MSHRLLPLAALLVALTVPGTASAATFKVVSATHMSSSTKTVERYQGTSKASWTLAKPTSKASNKVSVNRVAGMTIGMGMLNLRGTYSVDITTSWPGRCAWSAPTGDTEHPWVAPGPSQLSIGPDPNNRKRTFVALTAVIASLSNAYLGTECSTSVSGEPDADDVLMKAVSSSLFKRKTVKLTFSGSRTADDITYRWTTRLVLKRVRR